MSNWLSRLTFWKKTKSIFSEMEFIPPNSSDKSILLDEKNFSRIKLDKESIIVHVIEDEKAESTQDYLQKYNIKPSGLTVEEGMMIEDQKHRITSRNIVLLFLIVPMSIIPIWFSILLTYSFLNKMEIKQPVQLALISAIAVDFAGLYLVVTRDLFPQGVNGSKNSNDGLDDEDETDS